MYSNLKTPEQVTPPFWEQFVPDKWNKSRANFAKLAISHSEHPEFMGHIAELAQRAGLDYVPHVVVSEIQVGNTVAHTANAMAGSYERGIIINPKMMKLTNSSLHSRLSPELETVIAHELGHLKDGFLHYWTLQKGGLYAAPVIAMAGLYLYDKAHTNTEHTGGGGGE